MLKVRNTKMFNFFKIKSSLSDIQKNENESISKLSPERQLQIDAISIPLDQKMIDDDYLVKEKSLIELKIIMIESKRFKLDKIDAVVRSLAESFKPMHGFSSKGVSKEILLDSLSENFNQKNSNFYNMVNIACLRAHNAVNLENLSSKKLCTHVKLSFMNNTKYPVCLNMQKVITKYDGVQVLIKDAPILPLINCYDCVHCKNFSTPYRPVFDWMS